MSKLDRPFAGSLPRARHTDPLHEQVYQRVRWGLIMGSHAPGGAVSIRKVAAEMETSTMPVREALKRLVSERALVADGNRSFRVPSLVPKRVSDLFFLRSSLEGIATGLATPRLTAAQITRLEELAAQMDQDVDNGDAASYLSRNYSFHFTIYTASDNDELVSIIEGLWAQTGSFLAAGVHLVSLSPDWRRMHGRIAASIRARDGAAARAMIEQDINWGTRAFGAMAEGLSDISE